MRVLIADDSAFMRRMLTKLFESGRGFEVVGTARNGTDAVQKCADLKPDVLTLDVEMPEMDGIEALRKIRAANGPTNPAILMCSTLTQAGSETALEALRLGAADVIAKEHLGLGEEHATFRAELLTKVRAIGLQALRARRPEQPARPSAASPSFRKPSEVLNPIDFDLIAIGSSTGGPPVLEQIVESILSDRGKPIVIAQHMPSLFTKSLASRLDTVGPARVVLAEHGTRVEPGHVYIAEGGKHLRLNRRVGKFVLEVSGDPADALYKPSVNELFHSVAAACGARTLGVVLTGMGDDGFEGAKTMVDKGARIIAQDEDSCVVYGMPRAVTEGGLTCVSMDPAHICHTIATVAEGKIPGTRFRASA